MRPVAKAILLSPNPFSCMLSSCLAMPWVVALMNHWHESLGSFRTSKGLKAEAKRIICVKEGWNLTKRSFFFVSFLQWKMRVSLAFEFICSRAPAWRAVDTWSRGCVVQ